jgi:integrase
MSAFAREYDLLTATPAQVQAYLGNPSRGPNGRKSVLATLRSFFRWATARGYVEQDPTRLARTVRVPPGIPKPVPEAVLARALAHSDKETRLMLLLGAYAGLRRAEIAGLHSRDVTDNGLIITGKGGRTRRIPIHPRLATELGFHGYAFPSNVRIGQPVGPSYVASRVEAVLEGYTCHSLRHRFGTMTYRGSKDIRATQMLLGHSSPTTTALYVLIDEDELEAAVLAVA